MSARIVNSELHLLRTLSARAGSDPLLVQGAGGNTSVKQDDTLWIKASGTWLAHALGRDIMVPVTLQPLIAAFNAKEPSAEKAHQFVDASRNPSALRPSIETTVHAVIPQRIVVHVHCVSTIALSVRQDAQAAIAPLLDGLGWIYVPYARPGLPLAMAIAERQKADTRVHILANHGLIVSADSVEEASALLDTVCARLGQTARQAPTADQAELENAAAGSPYAVAKDACHGTATDPISLDHASLGSLYPDHVVFLGPGSAIAHKGETASDVVKRATAAGAREPMTILFPGRGVLVHDRATPGARAMVRCLADVTARIPNGAAINVLNAAQESELLDWDAEKYRQALSRAGAAQ